MSSASPLALSYALTARAIATQCGAKASPPILVGSAAYIAGGSQVVFNQGGGEAAYGEQHARMADTIEKQFAILMNYASRGSCFYAGASRREVFGPKSGRPQGWVRGDDGAADVFSDDAGSVWFVGEGGVLQHVTAPDNEHCVHGPLYSCMDGALEFTIDLVLPIPGSTTPQAVTVTNRELAALLLQFHIDSTLGILRTYLAQNYTGPDRDVARPMNTLVRARAYGVLSDETPLSQAIATQWLDRIHKGPGCAPFSSPATGNRNAIQPIDTCGKLPPAVLWTAQALRAQAKERRAQGEEAVANTLDALADVYFAEARRLGQWAKDILAAAPGNDAPYFVFLPDEVVKAATPVPTLATYLVGDWFQFDTNGPHEMYTAWLTCALSVADFLGVEGAAALRDSNVSRFKANPQYTADLVDYRRQYLF